MDETVFPGQGCGAVGGSLAHTGCPLLDIPGPVPMDAGEEAQRTVRFVCSDLNSKSLCLLSVLLSWIRGVNPMDLFLFHVLAFAISLSCSLMLKSSSALSAFPAHFCFLSAVHLSGEFYPCVSAGSRQKPSLVMWNKTCWVAGSCVFPSYMEF